MISQPNIKANPLKVTVYMIVLSYIIGDFILPKYPIIYFFKMIGILGLIISLFFLFSGFSIFNSYDENPSPNSSSERLIKTGIFAYTRNPIYISFILFHLSMFLIFENVMYFLSSIGLFIWIHHFVIKKEEEYLTIKFENEYVRYCNSVKRWLIF